MFHPTLIDPVPYEYLQHHKAFLYFSFSGLESLNLYLIRSRFNLINPKHESFQVHLVKNDRQPVTVSTFCDRKYYQPESITFPRVLYIFEGF